MTGYTRVWECETCGKRCESIDWPRGRYECEQCEAERGPSLCVGQLPGRKQPALYEVRDGRIVILAFFRSKAEMDAFLSWKPKYTRPAMSTRDASETQSA